MKVGRYALLDWDNTLRKGFTIIPWTKYLCERKAIREDTYCKLIEQFELHREKKISYKQLANKTTEIYALALTNVELESVEKLACDFCQKDSDVFQFSNKLFELFKKSGIDTVIISGSPKIVLLQYAKRFGIDEIYGMDIEVSNGRYTGKIKEDYGAKKDCLVKEICHSRKNTPFVAFGDAVSDEPLLSVAKYGYLLDWERERIVLNGHEIEPLSSIDTVIQDLSLAALESFEKNRSD